MRVLLCFPLKDGQTGPAIKKAFENLGHKVTAVDAKLEPIGSFPIALTYRPDLVFCSRTPSLADEINKIKRSCMPVVTCCWNTDTRNKIEEWRDFDLFPLIQAVDYYFVPAKRLLPEWRKLNPNTHWLPQGLQDEVYHKPDRKTNLTFSEYEVSFAGSLTGYHSWRVDYLHAVIKAGFHIKVHGCMGLPQVYNQEHNKMVAMSKINLGMSGWPQNESYVSVRDYKIMGAGGFLLERSRPGLFDIFPEGGLATYENPEDLVNMIQVFLKNDEARKKIAEVGHEWVQREATYTDRIRKAFEIMEMK